MLSSFVTLWPACARCGASCSTASAAMVIHPGIALRESGGRGEGSYQGPKRIRSTASSTTGKRYPTCTPQSRWSGVGAKAAEIEQWTKRRVYQDRPRAEANGIPEG